MLKKLKIAPKNILLESLAMILIILGSEKIQISFYSEEYRAMFKMDGDKLDQLGAHSIGELVMDTFWWGFGALLIVSILIGTLKLWRNKKKGLMDTVLALALVFALFPIGLFNSGLTHEVTNLVGSLFSNELYTKMMITGFFWSIIGILIIWYATKYTKHKEVYH